MRFVAKTSFVSLVLVASLAACDDGGRSSPALPVAPLEVASDAISAYLAVSNASPAAGTPVTVYVRARRGSAVGAIGSFTIRLAYDSTRLTFRDAARSTHGMVMANGATRGLLVVAGASAEGFTDDELLAATFLVNGGGADALKSLTLTVSELNSVRFENQSAKASVAHGLFRDGGTLK